MTADGVAATTADLFDSYDPFSAYVKQDPAPYWKAMRDRGGVHKYVLPEALANEITSNPLAARSPTEFYSLLGYADVVEALGNPKTFINKDGPGPEFAVPLEEADDGVLIFADGPAHLRQRRLVARAFTPRAVDVLLPWIQTTVDDLIDAAAARGSMDVLADLATPLSIRAISNIMGIPDEHAADFRRWGNAIVASNGGNAAIRDAGMAAMQEMFAYLQQLIDALRAGTADAISPSLTSGVLAALVNAEADGTRLSDNEIRLATMQLVTAGFETTSTGIASGVHLLCTHREQLELLRQDPTRYKAAVDEVLRIASPLEGLFRTTKSAVEMGGCPIAAASKVRMCFAAANLDERQFSEPERFEVCRDPAQLRSHVAFGHGPHSCPGAALARAELRIALETLFRRIPDLHLDDTRPPVRNTMLNINGFTEVHVRWSPSTVLPRAVTSGLGS